MLAADVSARVSAPTARIDPPALDLASTAFRTASALTPVGVGQALAGVGVLAGGAAKLAAGDQGGSSRLDDTRNTGRGDGGIRPTLGDGPGGEGSTIGPNQPGFPTPPAPPASGDGSGTHGVDSPSLGDRLFEQVAYRAADAADAIGMSNAARHMRHYLGNSGETLNVDPARMKADMPAIRTEMDRSFQTQVRDVALREVQQNWDGKATSFQITTPWNGAYATKGMSQDWFYGIGGFSYAHTATVTVTPGADGAANVRIDSQTHVFDRYNWDGGKAVTIGPVTVTDERMGRLHEVGLAQEYEVRGTATGPSASFTVPASQLDK